MGETEMGRGAAVTWERPEEMNGWLTAGHSANAASQQQQRGFFATCTERRPALWEAPLTFQTERQKHFCRGSGLSDFLLLLFFCEVNLNSVRFSGVVSKVNYKVAH